MREESKLREKACQEGVLEKEGSGHGKDKGRDFMLEEGSFSFGHGRSVNFGEKELVVLEIVYLYEIGHVVGNFRLGGQETTMIS
jgi:hypothetical protein